MNFSQIDLQGSCIIIWRFVHRMTSKEGWRLERSWGTPGLRAKPQLRNQTQPIKPSLIAQRLLPNRERLQPVD